MLWRNNYHLGDGSVIQPTQNDDVGQIDGRFATLPPIFRQPQVMWQSKLTGKGMGWGTPIVAIWDQWQRILTPNCKPARWRDDESEMAPFTIREAVGSEDSQATAAVISVGNGGWPPRILDSLDQCIRTAKACTNFEPLTGGSTSRASCGTQITDITGSLECELPTDFHSWLAPENFCPGPGPAIRGSENPLWIASNELPLKETL